MINFINKYSAKTEYEKQNSVALFPITMTRESRIQFYKKLASLISSLEVIETSNGLTLESNPVLNLITYRITASNFRHNLEADDLPYINRYIPLVMYKLNKVHGYKYEDWWLHGNPNAHYLLGNELRDLLYPIEFEEGFKFRSSDLWYKPLGDKYVRAIINGKKRITKGMFETGMIRLKHTTPLYVVNTGNYPKSMSEEGLPVSLMETFITVGEKNDDFNW